MLLSLILPLVLGQTPPPASGDWDIFDNTVITDQNITLNGNVNVKSGGVLTLDNVTDALRKRMQKTLDGIEKRFGKVLAKWDGAVDKVEPIKEELVVLMGKSR